jgi:hypothetical protein
MNVRRILTVLMCTFALSILNMSFADAQSYRWDGTAPICRGECLDNETEVFRASSLPAPPLSNPVDFLPNVPPFGNNCSLGGEKVLCQLTPGRTKKCRVDGTAPFCDGECRAGEDSTSPATPGTSFGAGCWTGSKKFCCYNAITTGVTKTPLTTGGDPSTPEPPPDDIPPVCLKKPTLPQCN